MIILDGKKLAKDIEEELKQEIGALIKKGISPCLGVILVGNDAASEIYVAHKKKACQNVGIVSRSLELDKEITEESLLGIITDLNKDPGVHGILVQLPLPKHINSEKIISAISPQKDVDCFHPENVGKLSVGQPRFLPCTPAGIIEILKRYDISIEGKECVVVGRSNIVGKPLGSLFLGENGTVTIAHRYSKNLQAICQRADILAVAVGKPGIITKDMIKPGAVVIDVGINRGKDGKLVGDVDFEKVGEISSAITPVPGGVGPMTIVMLMKNTIEAAKRLKDKG